LFIFGKLTYVAFTNFLRKRSKDLIWETHCDFCMSNSWNMILMHISSTKRKDHKKKTSNEKIFMVFAGPGQEQHIQTLIIIIVPIVAYVVLIISICIYFNVVKRENKKSNNSVSPFDIIFYHLIYVVRWFSILFYF
jgi:hypothetical protein